MLSPSASLPPSAHHFTSSDQNAASKSRRKPRHTNRIVPQSQHFAGDELNGDDDAHASGGVQTQPLNLSVTPTNLAKQLSKQHLELNARRAGYNSSPATTDDDVLDLSRSRSDPESEPEPIEEDEEDEEEEITAKDNDAEDDEDQEEEIDEADDVVMMHHQKSNFRENGNNKHFSRNGNHISHHNNNNNNNHCSSDASTILSAKLKSLEERATLFDKGNGTLNLDGTLNLAALGLAKLENLKNLKSLTTNGVPVPLIKPSNESAKVVTTAAAEAISDE